MGDKEPNKRVGVGETEIRSTAVVNRGIEFSAPKVTTFIMSHSPILPLPSYKVDLENGHTLARLNCITAT